MAVSKIIALPQPEPSAGERIAALEQALTAVLQGLKGVSL